MRKKHRPKKKNAQKYEKMRLKKPAFRPQKRKKQHSCALNLPVCDLTSTHFVIVFNSIQ